MSDSDLALGAAAKASGRLPWLALAVTVLLLVGAHSVQVVVNVGVPQVAIRISAPSAPASLLAVVGQRRSDVEVAERLGFKVRMLDFSGFRFLLQERSSDDYALILNVPESLVGTPCSKGSGWLRQVPTDEELAYCRVLEVERQALVAREKRHLEQEVGLRERKIQLLSGFGADAREWIIAEKIRIDDNLLDLGDVQKAKQYLARSLERSRQLPDELTVLEQQVLEKMALRDSSVEASTLDGA